MRTGRDADVSSQLAKDDLLSDLASNQKQRTFSDTFCSAKYRNNFNSRNVRRQNTVMERARFMRIERLAQRLVVRSELEGRGDALE